MSASASKKKRKELIAQGQDSKSVSAQKASQKKKKTMRTIIIFALVVVVAVAGIIALLKYLESRRYAPDYDVSKPVATVGEQKISVPVYNMFYSMTANNFASQWGQYGLIQSGVPFSQQTFLSDQTVEQYLISYTNSSVQAIYNVYAKAQEDGFELSGEAKAEIESAIKNIKDEAEQYGYSNVDHYLSARIGKGTDLDAYKEYLNVYQTYLAYSQQLQDEFDPSADELETAYKANPDQYDLVNFTYQRFTAEGTTDEDTGETSYTDEAKAEAKQKAEEAVKEMPEESTTVTYGKDTVGSNLSEEIAEWLFDSARKKGDAKVFDGNETGSYYLAVRYNSRETNEYSRVSAFVVSVQKDTDIVEEGTMSSEEKITAIKAGLTDGMSDEDFISLLADAGYSTSASLQTKSANNEEVTSYLFASARKAGDTKIIETDDYYYVVRYVSTEEGTYRDSLIRSALLDEMYQGITNGTTIEVDEDMLKHANTDLTLNASSAAG